MQEQKNSLVKKQKHQPITNKFQSMKQLQNSFSYNSISMNDQIIQRPQFKPQSSNSHQHTSQCAHQEDGQQQQQSHQQIHHQQSNIHHGQTFQFRHNHTIKNKNNHNHNHQQKNYVIIAYTVFTTLCCWYLILFYFTTQIKGFEQSFWKYLINFTVFMCLWSYYKTVRINNKPFNLKKQKYFQKKIHIDPIYDIISKQCKICQNYKYPRVSHCSNCRQCVYKLDHHCIWSQNCIGFKNQRTFYLFTFYMFIGTFQYALSSYNYFFVLMGKPKFWHQHEWTFYLLWAITNVSVFFVGMMIIVLFFVHTNLIFTNTTTLDLIKSKGCFSIPFFQFRQKNLKYINYFDRGQIANISNLFGNNLLTFWMPLERKIRNEMFPESMSPQPSRLQIHLWDEKLAKQEFEREQKMKNFLNDVNKLYKGKKLLINNQVIILK